MGDLRGGREACTSRWWAIRTAHGIAKDGGQAGKGRGGGLRSGEFADHPAQGGYARVIFREIFDVIM